MDKLDMNGIWKEIKANRAKLDSCEGHDFSILINPDKLWQQKYQCTHCKGVAEANEKRWYELGLKHGKK